MLRVVTGPIAAGKSTILRHLEQRGEHVIYESWTNHPILSAFYANPKDHAYRFQMLILGHYDRITLPADGKSLYVERSPRDVLEVFLPMQRDNMTASEYRHCRQWAQTILQREMWREARYICLRVTPEQCCHRVIERARKGECTYEPEYFRAICRLYEALKWTMVYPNSDWADSDRVVSQLIKV